MENKINQKNKLDHSIVMMITEGKFIIGSITYTSVSAILYIIGDYSNWKGQIALTCIFLSAICFTIIQLILLNQRTNSDIGQLQKSSEKSLNIVSELKEYIEQSKNIIPHTDFTDLSAEIGNLIKTNKVDCITIICYGTSAYGDVVHKINKLNSRCNEITTIGAKVLVCSPLSSYILHESDRDIIRNMINEYKTDDIVFSESDLPPTIRGCVIYNKEKRPIYSSIQTYYYNANRETHSFDYRNFFAIVARENNANLLDEMKIIIEEEFIRLSSLKIKNES